MFKGLFALSKKCCEDKGLETDGERVTFKFSKLSILSLDTNFIFCSASDLLVCRNVLSSGKTSSIKLSPSRPKAHLHL